VVTRDECAALNRRDEFAPLRAMRMEGSVRPRNEEIHEVPKKITRRRS